MKLVPDGKYPPVMYYIFDGEQKLAITTKEAGEQILEIQKDALFMADVWKLIRQHGYEFVAENGDPEGVDFVSNRILARQEKK